VHSCELINYVNLKLRLYYLHIVLPVMELARAASQALDLTEDSFEILLRSNRRGFTDIQIQENEDFRKRWLCVKSLTRHVQRDWLVRKWVVTFAVKRFVDRCLKPYIWSIYDRFLSNTAFFRMNRACHSLEAWKLGPMSSSQSAPCIQYHKPGVEGSDSLHLVATALHQFMLTISVLR
jgi:hypothetical protein